MLQTSYIPTIRLVFLVVKYHTVPYSPLRYPTLPQLVVEAGVSVTVLMFISAAFVCAGFLLGMVVITKRNALSREEGDSPPRHIHNPLQARSAAGARRGQRQEVEVEEGDATWWGARRKRMARKVAMFGRQLQYLRRALRCKPLLALLGLWIVGNAVFTVSHPSPIPHPLFHLRKHLHIDAIVWVIFRVNFSPSKSTILCII